MLRTKTIVGIFLICCLALGLRWSFSYLIDDHMWGNQARYVAENDSRQFDFSRGYAHPGGPIVEGAVVLHKVFGISFDQAVYVFVILFNSLVITSICYLCYTLRKNMLWVFAVLGILTLSWFYQFLTPTSAVAIPLQILLTLLSLYLYENKGRFRKKYLVGWALVAGLAIATRIDSGGLFFAALFSFLLLTRSVNWKVAASLVFGTFLSFSIFNHYMWYMPIQHLKDLFFQMTYHYSDFPASNLGLPTIVTISILALLSIFLSLFALYFKKLTATLPSSFVAALLTLSIVLYTIMLTSHLQAIRYFVPIILVWEIFLPLQLFVLIDHTQTQKSKHSLKIAIILLLFFCQFILL